MKRKPEHVTAAAFIAVLAVCLAMALSGGVRRLLGDRTVDIYQIGRASCRERVYQLV